MVIDPEFGAFQPFLRDLQNPNSEASKLRAALDKEESAEMGRLRIENTKLQAQLTLHQWRPIATAPKDGRRIIAYGKKDKPYESVVIVRWNSAFEEWSRPGAGVEGLTHWMPLPELPAEATE
jgi:hypothetical protein